MGRLSGLLGAAVLAAGLASASITYQYTTAAVNYTGAGSVDVSGTCTANTVNNIAASYCIDFTSSTAGSNYVIAYSGVTNESGTAGPPPIGTSDTFGYFEIFCEVAGTSTTTNTCGTTTFSGDVSINVNQSLPAVFTGTYVDALSGTLTNPTSGAVVLTFSTTSFDYNTNPPTDLHYYLQQPTFPANGYLLGPNTVTSIQGGIIDESAPEPGTLATLGLGLAALGLYSRRKRA